MQEIRVGGKNAANMAIRNAVLQLTAASVSIGKLTLFSDFDLPPEIVLRLQEIDNVLHQQARAMEDLRDEFLADLPPQKHNGMV